MAHSDPIYSYISARLRHLRRSRNLRQYELAKLLSVSTQQYQKYETGLSKWPIPTVLSLCQIYNVPVDAVIPVALDNMDHDGPHMADQVEGMPPIDASAQDAATLSPPLALAAVHEEVGVVPSKKDEAHVESDDSAVILSQDDLPEQVGQLLSAFMNLRDSDNRQLVIELANRLNQIP